MQSHLLVAQGGGWSRPVGCWPGWIRNSLRPRQACHSRRCPRSSWATGRCGRRPTARSCRHSTSWALTWPRTAGPDIIRLAQAMLDSQRPPWIDVYVGLSPCRRREQEVVAVHGSTSPAHPRRRGEHGPEDPMLTRPIGSSPQARGTRRELYSPVQFDRLIPAGAGNTCSVAGDPNDPAAHPRRRREHGAAIPCGCAGDGSSPQARGTLAHRHQRAAPVRLIPAGAGNTTTAACSTQAATAHPRGCREHCIRIRARLNSAGSSPQARGTRPARPPCRARIRLIPAGAGNTSVRCSATTRRSAHPRRRGEHTTARARASRMTGSSPQARGTRRSNGAWRSWASAHPRRRGEHLPALTPPWSWPGSSPQARGTHRHLERGAQPGRLIPAGAGNTAAPASRPRSPPAHPRRRGEHMPALTPPWSWPGSSPQARGTPSCCPDTRPVRRLIPAGAGNTHSPPSR